MIAVEDTHLLTRQPRIAARSQGVDHRLGLLCRILDQRCREPEFHAIELIVHGLIGNLECLASFPIRSIDRWLNPQDPGMHQLDSRTKPQPPFILLLSCPLAPSLKTL